MHPKTDSPKQRDKAERKRRGPWRPTRACSGRPRSRRRRPMPHSHRSDCPPASSVCSRRCNARGPLHQQELARTLGRSKAQMTAIIDALEKRALATRERHATDRRFTTVHITESGARCCSTALPGARGRRGGDHVGTLGRPARPAGPASAAASSRRWRRKRRRASRSGGRRRMPTTGTTVTTETRIPMSCPCRREATCASSRIWAPPARQDGAPVGTHAVNHDGTTAPAPERRAPRGAEAVTPK